jgi:CRP-like cAMP-binding protein
VREGTADDRFYVIVTGRVAVESHGKALGSLREGDCFGETGYISGARSIAGFRAQDAVTVLSVSSTMLEQVSTECQLRFNKVFLRTLIRRLQGANAALD